MDEKKRSFDDVEMYLDEFGSGGKFSGEKKPKQKKTDAAAQPVKKSKPEQGVKTAKTKKAKDGVKASKSPKSPKIGKDGKEKKPSKFVTKWKALKKWQRVTIIVVAVIVLLALIAWGVVYGVYDGFRTNINEDNLGISSEIEDTYGDTGIFNIAVFGLDTRDENSFSGRSDSIIIVSVDRKNNTVKLTSILRDSYVAIDGHDNQKITHAYSFGGAELAIKTINQNFGMNITDYATINFYKLAKAIDVLGGIDINITESEMNQINDIGDDEGKVIEQVTQYGNVHLNGDQAAVYCRLRELDSDVARSNRQKTVINALIVKAKEVSPTKYPEMVKSIMALCETSLSFSEVMSFAPMITENIDIQTITVPGDEENAVGGIYDGAWVWRYDLKEASNRIHEFIYGEAATNTADTATTTSKSSGSKTTTTTKKSSGSTTTKKSSSSNTTTHSQSTDDTTQHEETTKAPETTTAKALETTTEAASSGNN